jgi:hypothetical protein
VLARGAACVSLRNLILTLGGNDMKSLKLTAAFLALAMPSMALAAVDGTLGATSTGSVFASLTLTAPPLTQVQVLGVDDFIFGGYAMPTTFTPDFGGVVATATITGVSTEQFLCLNRSDLGQVRLNYEQVGTGGAFGPTLTKSGSAIGYQNSSYMVLVAEIISPDGTVTLLGNGVSGGTIAASGAGCTSASGAGVAHRLRIRDPRIIKPIGMAPSDLAGTYSGTVSITIAVP